MLQVEDAEFVGAKGLTILAALGECSHHLQWFPLGFPRHYSLEEVCRPSFDVLNCWLNLVAICLDDENEIPLKVIASFSVSRFALPSIPLIVLHSLVRSVFWSMVSTKSLHFFRLCTHNMVLDGFIQSWQFS